MTLKNLSQRLERRLVTRQIQAGLDLLRRELPIVKASKPDSPDFFKLLAWTALWVDAGWEAGRGVCTDLLRLARPLSGSRKARRAPPVPSLRLQDYCMLRLAEGVLGMRTDLREAVPHLEFVVETAPELGESPWVREIQIIALYCKARCLRNLGRYEEAKNDCTSQAILLTRRLGGHHQMLAVLRLVHGWLQERTGNRKKAEEELRQAWDGLVDTDDHLAKGNVLFYQARIASRSKDRHQEALQLFGEATRLFGMHDDEHRNIAHALVHRAFVSRQLACESNCSEHRAEARRALKQAEVIYRKLLPAPEGRHGLASVYLNEGYLRLDEGDAARAVSQAKKALDLVSLDRGRTRHVRGQSMGVSRDPLITVRSHVLLAVALCKQRAFGLDRKSRPRRSIHWEDALRHAEAAHELQEAITGQSRLKIRVQTALGMAWLYREPFSDENVAKARFHHMQAKEMWQVYASDSDYIADELSGLHREIMNASTHRPIINLLAEGKLPGQGMNLDSIVEAVKEEIVRSVYQTAETHKATAQRLGIHPKTVGSILAGGKSRRRGSVS